MSQTVIQPVATGVALKDPTPVSRSLLHRWRVGYFSIRRNQHSR